MIRKGCKMSALTRNKLEKVGTFQTYIVAVYTYKNSVQYTV